MLVAAAVVTMMFVVVVVSGSGQVGVHVFGARDEGAQVVYEGVQRPRVVCAEERDDLREARECAVPFLFGGVFACAVEEHAEAARRAVLLCGRVTRAHPVIINFRVARGD